MGAARYFELRDEKSDKFWEITANGLTVSVRYGRRGTTGQTQAKTFDNEAAAQKHTAQLIDEKAKKGYVERPR